MREFELAYEGSYGRSPAVRRSSTTLSQAGRHPGPDVFVDTAAAMACCDLVITVDTSVAHLAGALGIRTWVALPCVADWRWLIDRQDSPWYVSARLFRQRSRGAWESVFAEMKAVLRDELKTS